LSRRSKGSRSSGSSSRSRTGSVISGSRAGSSARSRAQSLIQSIGATSRSSLELVQTTARLRANSSMARLEEDLSYHSDTPSQPSSPTSPTGSNNENHTFGHPMFSSRENTEDQIVEVPRRSTSNVSVNAPSGSPSQRAFSPTSQGHVEVTGQSVSDRGSPIPGVNSGPDISVTVPSVVIEPATQEDTPEANGQTGST
jgi:hypothetical protein